MSSQAVNGLNGTRPYLVLPRQFATLASFWLAYHFLWTAILPYVIPAKAEEIGGLNWGLFQGLVLSVGAAFSAFVQLTIGFISDSTLSPFGRRKPYIFAGVLFFIPSVIFFFSAGSFSQILVGYLLLQLFVNIAGVPYQAMLPDLVPADRHGMASAFMGIFDLLGKLLGTLTMISLFTLPKFFNINLLNAVKGREFLVLSIVYIFLFVGLSSVVLTRVPSWPVSRLEKSYLPMRIRLAGNGGGLRQVLKNYLNFDFSRNMNFLLLLFSRTSVYFAFYIFVPNVYHFVRWNLGKDPEVLVPIFLATMILLGIIGNLIGGLLSDRIGKKPVVGTCISLLSILLFPLIFSRGIVELLLLGLLIGIAWGGFLSADWAFACTLIPKDKTARYMGVWDLSTLFPQVLATMLVGIAHYFLINLLSGAEALRQMLALRYIFSSSIFFFLLGLIALYFVKEEKPISIKAKINT